ncbi:hypothetical protein GGU10DRAFT_68750 [Lentinula aff. detonsa]|uniref:Uncharacterized protein n=1 Tax=Lentinula aff. detonsa TaxID=2804958 RepID=A0AA38NKE1_9AGAR|nr:hypothetical protein GGU10DRAFT_68750 [Lentinula aff. detonsa]
MVLALVEIMCTIPIGMYIIYKEKSALKSSNSSHGSNSELHACVQPRDPTTPSTKLDKMRKSIAETDSRSTICFPDNDDVELGPYRKSFSRDISYTLPSSSPSSSTYAPHTPVSPTTLPPSYVDSTYLDAAASTLHHDLRQSSRVNSWVTLPDMIIETSDNSKYVSRPSLYLSYSFSIPPCVQRSNYSHEEEDDLSITDAYSCPVSPAGRAQHRKY